MMDTQTLRITTPSDLEITMSREFNAPRALVFEAMTNPNHLKKWFYGPDGWELAECTVALEVGGRYRYVWRGPDGMTMATGGVCKEIAPPEKWVCTEAFEDAWYAGESLVTMLWKENGESTDFSMNMRFETKEARDGALQSGMETGVAASYDRLAAILAEVKA